MSNPALSRRRLLHGAIVLGGAASLSACVVVPASRRYGGYGGYDAYGGYDGAYADVVGIEPPPPPYEAIPVAPGPGYIWIGGFWNWMGGSHVWIGGRWAQGRPGYYWEPYRWHRQSRGWQLAPGGWRRR